jgi:hypothetical protein
MRLQTTCKGAQLLSLHFFINDLHAASCVQVACRGGLAEVGVEVEQIVP